MYGRPARMTEDLLVRVRTLIVYGRPARTSSLEGACFTEDLLVRSVFSGFSVFSGSSRSARLPKLHYEA